jgi:DNA repair exonuclease SbcCD ATPase subunit
MIIKRVQIHNFFIIENADVELGAGAFWLEGDNQDEIDAISNGSGKSTFCRAIVWALFGDALIKGLRVDQVIGNQDSWCQVILHLEKDGKSIKIDRARKMPGRRTNDALIEVDGEAVSQHSDNTTHIQKLLELGSELFYYAGYSSSATRNFCSLSGAEVTTLLTQALDLDKYDEIVKALKDKNKKHNVEKQVLQSTMSNYLQWASTAKSSMESFKLALLNHEADKERQADKIRAELDRLYHDTEDLAELEEEIKEMEKEVELHRWSKLSVSETEGLISSTKALLKDSLKTLNSKSIELKNVEAGYNSAKAAFDNIMFSVDNVCGYCNSKFQMDSALKHARKFEDEMNRLAIQQASLQSECNILEIKTTDQEKDIRDLNTSLQEFQGVYQLFIKSEALLADLLNKKAAQSYIAGIIASRKTDLAEVLAGDDSQLRQSLKDAKKTFKDISTKYSDAESKMEDLMQDIEALEIMIPMISKVKRKCLNDFMIELQVRMNVYLLSLSGDITCSLEQVGTDLSLVFTAPSKKGIMIPYQFLSDGEKVKVDKSCALALNDIFDVGLYIDDEGVKYLDHVGTDTIFSFMSKKADANTTKIFVTNIPGVSDRFPIGKIVVTKKNGIATIKKER